MKNKNKNKKEKKDECPLCKISEEAIKILKEKGKKSKLKERPKNNGE